MIRVDMIGVDAGRRLSPFPGRHTEYFLVDIQNFLHVDTRQFIISYQNVRCLAPFSIAMLL